jgi:hypothetical protein
VCLDRPCNYVKEELKAEHINLEKFFFIDLLSSHYYHMDNQNNCIFLEEPFDISKIEEAVTNAQNSKKCQTFVFDSVSSLLARESAFLIVKFTHNLANTKLRGDARKIFIIQKEAGELSKDINGLAKDLSMFADETIDWAD